MAPFWKRLTQPIPDPAGKEVIWIHGVSVGEIKSAQRLFQALQTKYPSCFFLLTTTTAAGQEEARRSFPTASAICYLPLDTRLVHKLKPKLFFLIETDFWPHLLRAVRRNGGKNILVSGKLSEKSASRFRKLSFFSRPLFNLFDLLCVQNEEHHARFLPLVPDPTRLHITGNLKLDTEPQPVDLSTWRTKLQPSPQTITLASTHAPEEALLLDLLLPHPDLFLFLAPRHPQRFAEVAALLRQRAIPFRRWSNLEERRGGERVFLVDAMGQLPICYSLSRLAIVCGSFTPIGGHNILEPCSYGTPVLFGPHMHTQTELVSRVLSSGAGYQTELSQLLPTITSFFQNFSLEITMRNAAFQLSQNCRGSFERTLSLLVK